MYVPVGAHDYLLSLLSAREFDGIVCHSSSGDGSSISCNNAGILHFRFCILIYLTVVIDHYNFNNKRIQSNIKIIMYVV